MIYRVPSRPFPDEILRMLANPLDPRAFYRRKVGNFILEPLVSIEKQALLRKAAKLAGMKPEDVNLPPVKPLPHQTDALKPNQFVEIKRYLKYYWIPVISVFSSRDTNDPISP